MDRAGSYIFPGACFFVCNIWATWVLALFEVIDVRRADVRRETAHFRPAASCDMGAVAMGRELWAMGFNRSACGEHFYNRSLRSLALRAAFLCHPGLRSGLSLGMFGNGEWGNGKWAWAALCDI